MAMTDKGKHYAKGLNDVTGDRLTTGHATDAYKEGHTRIFGKSKLELKLEEEKKNTVIKGGLLCERYLNKELSKGYRYEY